MRISRAIVVSFFALLAAVPAGASSHPNSMTQPPNDGCARDPAELISGTSPQWAYVNRDAEPKYIRGTVIESRPTNTDNFRAHDSYDMNWNVRPLPKYASFLSTANLRADAGEERGTIHNEWEQRAYPLFAWPTVGDDIEMLGSYIWDCGHWSGGDFTDPVQGPLFLAPGTQPGEEITGEKTEIHPPRMVVVHRATPSTARSGASVADVVISSNGTLARANLDHIVGSCTDPTFDSCSQWQPVNDRDYAFDVTAPLKPAGTHHVVYAVVDHASKNAPKPRISMRPGGIHVVVPFKGWGKTGDEMVFAKSFQVGWDAPRTVRHYKVTVTHLDWLVELDGPETGFCNEEFPCTGSPQFSRPPDEVNLFVDVAGQWAQLAPPGLLTAAPGDAFDLNKTFDAYVPAGSKLRILGRGRECEQPGQIGCPTTGEIGFDNDGGIFENELTASTAPGAHVGIAKSGDCTKVAKSPCFKLAYAVQDLGLVNVAGAKAVAGETPVSLPATGGASDLVFGFAMICASLTLLLIARRRWA